MAYPHTVTAVERTFSTGGTDYVFYDRGDGIDTTELLLENSTSLKSVLGSYDLHPDVVQNQLQAMCDTGQRKISLIVWFFPFLPEWGMVQDGVYISHRLPYISNRDGKLTSRFEQNVRNVVSLIANLKTNQNAQCFNELQFRFAPMGIAQPLGWSTWDELRYQEDWNFIYNTRNLITSVIGSAPLTVYYDLGGEQGGQTGGQNIAYIKRLLADYNATFGINDTYGFSIAWDPGRFKKLIETYDQVGIRPPQHAVDIYDESNQGMGPQLSALYDEMKQTGEQNTPIIIQETYYNDVQAYDQIISAKNQLGIPIRTIMQWQVTRGHMDSWNIGSSYAYFAPNTPSPTPKPGDVNTDGRVDIFDYNLLVSGFGNPYTIFDYNNLVEHFEE